jgi:hypothetical protein
MENYEQDIKFGLVLIVIALGIFFFLTGCSKSSINGYTQECRNGYYYLVSESSMEILETDKGFKKCQN